MAKSSFGTNVYGPDTSFIEGVGNIASMFDPKTQAAAALSKAHADYYGNQGRLATANAIAAEDQNSALSENVLMAAGYTPMQIAAIRATRSKSVTDVFKGVNLNTGANILQDPNGNSRVGMTLLGQGAAASNPNYALTQEDADAVALRNSANRIAELQQTPRALGMGQTAYNLNPDGSTNTLLEAPINVGAGDTIIDRTSTGVNELFRSPVQSNTRGTDPIRHANAVTALQNRYRNNLLSSVSPLDATGMNYALLPDPAQANSITSYAIGLVQDGKVPAELALAESAKAHGVTLGLDSIDPNTKKFKNFRLPPPPAPVVAPVAPVTSNLSNTIVGGATANANAGDGESDTTDTTDTTDEADATAPETPTGMIRITNDAAGKAVWESLAPGTKYIAPDGKVLTKR